MAVSALPMVCAAAWLAMASVPEAPTDDLAVTISFCTSLTAITDTVLASATLAPSVAAACELCSA